MSEARTQKQTEAIICFFDRRNVDGSYIYTDQQVRNFLPKLVIDCQIDHRSSPPLQKLMNEFFEKAGIDVSQSKKEIAARIKTFYDEGPGSDTLAREFRDFCISLAAEDHKPCKDTRQKLGIERFLVRTTRDGAPLGMAGVIEKVG